MTSLQKAGLAAASAVAATAAHGQSVPVRVTADRADCPEAPLSLVVPESRLNLPHKRLANATLTPCQSEPAGPGLVRLTWIVRGLKKGEARIYELQPSTDAAVEVREGEKGVDILVGGKLFTRYDTTTGPNKPYFYPLIGPTGTSVVRHWPMEQVPGETNDHPHHRGLWFTHGDMNGTDFWSEGPTAGKTKHRNYATLESGPIFGRLMSVTDWIRPGNGRVAEDTRDIRVYRVAEGCLLDFTITLRAIGGDLTWGDTKEGSFGLRVRDTMRADAGKEARAEGHIENSAGQTQADAWGKPATWCDYWGPVEGKTVGIALFDHPENPRHPTTWHVRTYGLFAINPFGLHDFDPALKDNPKAGALITPDGLTTTFRYRVFLHEGDTHAAQVAERYAAWATPPRAEILPIPRRAPAKP